MSVDGPTVGQVKRFSGQFSADELSAALADDKIEWAEAIEAIHESQCVIIFVHFECWRLAAQNFGEDIVCVVSHFAPLDVQGTNQGDVFALVAQ